jgi:hypothetical protein
VELLKKIGPPAKMPKKMGPPAKMPKKMGPPAKVELPKKMGPPAKKEPTIDFPVPLKKQAGFCTGMVAAAGFRSSFATYQLQAQRVILLSLCGRCSQETSARVRINYPDGKQCTGLIMCQKCVEKNNRIDSLIRK